MMPRLESVWFNGVSVQYARLARVLEHTARAWCPDWDVSVRQIDEPRVASQFFGRFAGDNSWKLGYWTQAVLDAPDGARLLLLDTDTFITGPLDSLWDHAFDVAYTVRPVGANSRLPLNAGVIAIRVGDGTRRFMAEWFARDRQFLTHRARTEMDRWHKAYGGQNQASLGSLLETGIGERLGADIVKLPCEVWNCEDFCWAGFDPETTKIVHVKSGLRMAIFNIGASHPTHERLEKLWRALEREAESA